MEGGALNEVERRRGDAYAHHRAMSKLHEIRARYSSFLIALLLVALGFALFDGVAGYAQVLAVFGGALALSWVVWGSLYLLALEKLGADGRHINREVINRERGNMNYCLAREDGTVVRTHQKDSDWRKRKVEVVGVYGSWEEAEEAAYARNLRMAAKGKYSGRNGETSPAEPDF